MLQDARSPWLWMWWPLGFRLVPYCLAELRLALARLTGADIDRRLEDDWEGYAGGPFGRYNLARPTRTERSPKSGRQLLAGSVVREKSATFAVICYADPTAVPSPVARRLAHGVAVNLYPLHETIVSPGLAPC